MPLREPLPAPGLEGKPYRPAGGAVCLARDSAETDPYYKINPFHTCPITYPSPNGRLDDSGPGSGQPPKPSGAKATEIRDTLVTR